MLFYTPTTYPGQRTDREGRPGLVGALTYALYGHVPWIEPDTMDMVSNDRAVAF